MSRISGWFYRKIMKLAHRHNWHYMPPIYPDGDKQLWCKWCGIRHTIAKKDSRAKTLSGLTRHT